MFSTNKEPTIIAAYFKHDWLMVRAVLSICLYEEVLVTIKDYPELAPFACWVIGRSWEDATKVTNRYYELLSLMICVDN